MTSSLARRALSEFIGTALLLVAIVGSGITVTRLSPDNSALQLLVIVAVVGLALGAILFTLGPVSGAHINPAVSLAEFMLGNLGRRDTLVYVGAQLTGAIAGTVASNLMFGLPGIELSNAAPHTGFGLWLSELIATLGLLLVVFGAVRTGRTRNEPLLVAIYVAAACLFTSSACFANPAVTVGRLFTDTLTGIDVRGAGLFITAQLTATFAAVPLARFLFPVTTMDMATAAVAEEPIPTGRSTSRMRADGAGRQNRPA